MIDWSKNRGNLKEKDGNFFAEPVKWIAIVTAGVFIGSVLMMNKFMGMHWLQVWRRNPWFDIILCEVLHKILIAADLSIICLNRNEDSAKIGVESHVAAIVECIAVMLFIAMCLNAIFLNSAMHSEFLMIWWFFCIELFTAIERVWIGMYCIAVITDIRKGDKFCNAASPKILLWIMKAGLNGIMMKMDRNSRSEWVRSDRNLMLEYGVYLHDFEVLILKYTWSRLRCMQTCDRIERAGCIKWRARSDFYKHKVMKWDRICWCQYTNDSKVDRNGGIVRSKGLNVLAAKDGVIFSCRW